LKVKKLIIPLAITALGILFLLIPGLEPLGAITLLGGVSTLGVSAFGK
jgi:hypothetical protein